MTTIGDFKLFLNGKEVIEQEIRDCDENMSVTVDGLSVFYSFLPKIKKSLHTDWIDSIGSANKMVKIIKYQNSEETEKLRQICIDQISKFLQKETYSFNNFSHDNAVSVMPNGIYRHKGKEISREEMLSLKTKYESKTDPKKLEKEEIKYDIITNINREDKKMIQWTSKNTIKRDLNVDLVMAGTLVKLGEKAIKSDTGKITELGDKIVIEFSAEKQLEENYKNKIQKDKFDSLFYALNYLSEKDKTEKLNFTTLEKEILTQKQQGHLSTKHTKTAIMYLDEFLSEESCKNSQQKVADDWNRGDGLTIGIKDSQKELKAPIFTYCKVNKNALEELALRALYGHKKYNKNGADEDWQNFTRVDNGDFEYANAQFRHALEIGGEETEKEHLISSAWNAVSRLQIYLKNK